MERDRSLFHDKAVAYTLIQVHTFNNIHCYVDYKILILTNFSYWSYSFSIIENPKQKRVFTSWTTVTDGLQLVNEKIKSRSHDTATLEMYFKVTIQFSDVIRTASVNVNIYTGVMIS
jgi:hypothetical protein